MANAHNKKMAIFFFIFFAAIAISQILTWSTIEFADWDYWVNHMDSLLSHLQMVNLIFEKPPTHPGTFILLAGILGKLLGFSSEASLRGAVIVVNTLSICALSFIAYRLRPKSFWLIGVTIPFIFNKYTSSNPLDIAISGLLAVAFLLALWQYEKMKESPLGISMMHGIVLGIAAATRVHITLILGLPVVALLLFRVGLKRAVLITLLAAGVFLIFTPYLWVTPFASTKKVATNVSVYYQPKTAYLAKREIYRLSAKDLLILQAPFATMGYFMAAGLIFARKARTPLPKPFLFSLLLLSGISTWLVIKANVSLIRFLYPTIFALEILLFPEIEYLMKNLLNFNNKKHLDTIIGTLLIGTLIILLVLLSWVSRTYGYLPERYMFAAAELGAFAVLSCAFLWQMKYNKKTVLHTKVGRTT